MSGKSIFIQAIGLFGTVLFFLSYQCKNNRTLFRVQFVSYLCYTTHLLMLGAITGGISYVLNTVRSFCLGSRSSFLKGKIMCAALCVMQVAALIFTWDGWWSILPAGGREYCGHGRRVYVQPEEDPPCRDACQFAAVDHL